MHNYTDKAGRNKSQYASTNSAGSKSTLQLQDNRLQSAIQKKQVEALADRYTMPIQKKENKTGMPDNLKSGIENLSGHSMDDVKVHYNSDSPAQLNAHAYAQGTEIHIASGQEKHLAHEAWHVVQQKEGRVEPTMQMKGKVNVNDDKGLEKEADVMGAKAAQLKMQSSRFTAETSKDSQIINALSPDSDLPVQKVKWSTGLLDGKETNVNWNTSNLGGDEVGIEMQANPLGPEHLQGGPPKSGAQNKLMNMLPTDPHLPNADKYIRGHLLNDNLGGPGDPHNLFPITANANKEHEQVIESKVKKWVNDDKQWVKYHVKVNPGHIDLSQGIVNSQFLCNASVLDPTTGNPINAIAANITSQHKVTHTTDQTHAGGNGMLAPVGPQAHLHAALLSKSKKAGMAFDQDTLDHLNYLFTIPDAAKTLKKLLMEYEGIGKGTAAALSQFSATTATDKKVCAALNKVFNVIGNDELLSVIGDVYDEMF
jgi:hypothetical protein